MPKFLHEADDGGRDDDDDAKAITLPQVFSENLKVYFSKS